MTLSLRRRILVTTAPLVLLVVVIGVAGVGLLDNLGRRSSEIVRDNYVSLGAMTDATAQLAGAERMALAAIVEGENLDPGALDAFRQAVELARGSCRTELANITVPGEQAAAEALARSVEEVARRGATLFAAPPAARRELYYAPGTGLQAAFKDAELHVITIRVLNETAMRNADGAARDTARTSTIGLSVGVVLAVVLALLAVWRLHHAIVKPIETMTDAATAIGSGQLHRDVPVLSGDEIGRLAGAFNAMTQRLREYRQTNTDRLLRAQQTGQATIDSFPDPVVVIDPEGRVELANQMARRLLGVEPARDGKPGSVWQPPEPIRQPLTDALREQRPFLTERFDQVVSFVHEGKDRSFLPQVRPIRSPAGDTLGAAVVLNDVTGFRLLDRLKSDLVATVSHELKTPLTSVRLAVHVLLEEAVGPLEPKQTELLVDARENTERLLSMIEHLLALARLEQGREVLQPRPVNPAELLKHAAEVAAVRAEDRHVQIVVEHADDLPQVSVDAERFGHVLDNLMDNALTYTEPGGRVTLSATCVAGVSDPGRSRVRISVADTGVGIPPEFVPHVFDKFFRVPDQSRAPGTGLGLAIVREIVEAHGGEIACESESGTGTVFHITLPAWGDRP